MARTKKFKAPRITTVVGQDTEIHGDLRFKGGLHVDGTVRGNVIGDSDESSTLTLSEEGTVEGEENVIEAEDVGLDAETMRLVAGSPGIGAAGDLPPELDDFPVELEYVGVNEAKPRASLEARFFAFYD